MFEKLKQAAVKAVAPNLKEQIIGYLDKVQRVVSKTTGLDREDVLISIEHVGGELAVIAYKKGEPLLPLYRLTADSIEQICLMDESKIQNKDANGNNEQEV